MWHLVSSCGPQPPHTPTPVSTPLPSCFPQPFPSQLPAGVRDPRAAGARPQHGAPAHRAAHLDQGGGGCAALLPLPLLLLHPGLGGSVHRCGVWVAAQPPTRAPGRAGPLLSRRAQGKRCAALPAPAAYCRKVSLKGLPRSPPTPHPAPNHPQTAGCGPSGPPPCLRLLQASTSRARPRPGSSPASPG